MPSIYSNTTYKQLPKPVTLRSLLRQKDGGLLNMFKLFPLLTSGCKMVALLGRTAAGHRKSFIADHATIGTIFSHRRGKVTLAIQNDPHSPPAFVIDLPIYTPAFHRQMESDAVRIALESETKAQRRKLLEELVWAVYCNGRKIGYSIRRKEMSDEEAHVMRMLKGVSMGAGVLPCRPPEEKRRSPEVEMTYLRARFVRVVGSKDSEAMYMINPVGFQDGAELSIFFVRAPR